MATKTLDLRAIMALLFLFCAGCSGGGSGGGNSGTDATDDPDPDVDIEPPVADLPEWVQDGHLTLAEGQPLPELLLAQDPADLPLTFTLGDQLDEAFVVLDDGVVSLRQPDDF